jgi:hypothetical protein
MPAFVFLQYSFCGCSTNGFPGEGESERTLLTIGKGVWRLVRCPSRYTRP